ncbi:MAG: riboflavin biosynthesis protein RibF [Gemmataceae bacterium]|nr:riboflavin biosynthesis protein RibF [Gemmataceae bacterium]
MAIFTYALNGPMPEACLRSILTIGNFDGVHLGHQALLSETNCLMRALDGSAVAVTFDPHPSRLLRPDLVGQPLTTIADRCTLLTQQGADHVLILQTSPALLQLSPREFFERIIIDQLQARALVEGANFGFGRNREGTVEVLQSLCAEKNLPLSLVPPREVAGQAVSSSRVRADLLAGNVDVVAQLLGRPYRLAGVVGTGQKRGATLGFPTANLHEIATLIPGNGVYAVRAHFDGKTWPAAANVGPNPTFGENARKVEVHLIGFSGQLYDQSLAVDFVKKIRDTKPFGSAQELAAQIQRDVDDVRRILNVSPLAT